MSAFMGNNKSSGSQLCVAFVALALLIVMPSTGCVHVERSHWSGAKSPEQAMTMMQRAWNRGATRDLEELFREDRRTLVAAQSTQLRARMGRWFIASWSIAEEMCHARPDHFKLVYVRMILENLPTGRVDVIEHLEPLWLVEDRRLERWWLYSL